jgi:hypothetical protein
MSNINMVMNTVEMKSPKPSDDSDDIKKDRTDLVRLELKLLFQRFNYFLVGISFLVIAFAPIVSSSKFYADIDNIYFVSLAGIICIAGCWLSFFFAVVNHLSSIVLGKLGTIVDNPTHADSLGEWAKEPWEKIGDLLWPWGIFSDMVNVLKYPFGKEGVGKSAPHTYLAPFGFTVLWFIFWIILCCSIFYWLLLQYSYNLLVIIILLIIIGVIPLIPIVFYWYKVKTMRHKP